MIGLRGDAGPVAPPPHDKIPSIVSVSALPYRKSAIGEAVSSKRLQITLPDGHPTSCSGLLPASCLVWTDRHPAACVERRDTSPSQRWARNGAPRSTKAGPLWPPNGWRLSCGALKKDSFLNLRAPTASSAC